MVLIALLGVIALALVFLTTSASATVLCKTATDPCTGGTYGKGTMIEASLKSGVKSVLDTPFSNVECSKSTFKGEVTNPGGEEAIVSGSVSTLSLSECGSNNVSVVKKGTFTIESPKEANGTLKLEGLETTVERRGNGIDRRTLDVEDNRG
jgi:uncharacterized protein YceK